MREVFRNRVARIARYQKMREDLEALKVPVELEAMKQDGLMELEKSWEFDCSSGIAGDPPIREIPLTGVEYRAREIRANEKTMNFIKEKMDQKRKRHSEDKAFSDLIFDSLPEETTALDKTLHR